jgi:hypothetical protein
VIVLSDELLSTKLAAFAHHIYVTTKLDAQQVNKLTLPSTATTLLEGTSTVPSGLQTVSGSVVKPDLVYFSSPK